MQAKSHFIDLLLKDSLCMSQSRIDVAQMLSFFRLKVSLSLKFIKVISPKKLEFPNFSLEIASFAQTLKEKLIHDDIT